MRTVGAGLQTHLETGATTVCFLLKITPIAGTEFGVTSLDIDVDYDDGGGTLTYEAAKGLNQSAVKSSAGLEVANSEAMLLVGTNFTKAEINAGVLDYAAYVVYRINYKNQSDGRYLVTSGRTGIVRSNDDLSGVMELRGLSQQLKQNFVDLDSITCRARFGSQVGEEQFPCTFDAAALFQNDTVLSVGSEADREFTATVTPAAVGPNGALPFTVAIVEFLTGNNAGLTVETESVVGDVVTLRFHTPYDMVIGDTYKIRPDCDKKYEDSCIALYDNNLFNRSEPWTPTTEEAPSATPGAKVPGHGSNRS